MARSRRRRKSAAASIAQDTAFIANRLPWQWSLALGAFLFATFYWGLPAFIAWQLESVDHKIVRGMLEVAFGRRAHWAQWLGIALALICAFFAGWQAWSQRSLDRDGERDTALLARILARWFNSDR